MVLLDILLHQLFFEMDYCRRLKHEQYSKKSKEFVRFFLNYKTFDGFLTFKFIIDEHKSIIRSVPKVFKFAASRISSLKRTVAATWKTTLTSSANFFLSTSSNPTHGRFISPETQSNLFKISGFLERILSKTYGR